MTWSIVLAGGSGTRLADEVRRRTGRAVPKQFCDFDGTGTLLDHAIRRARRFSSPGRVLVVTTRAHRDDATAVLARNPGVVAVEQPCGRETTPAVALPLLVALARGPDDEVVLLPSDAHVADEEAFARAVRRALALVRQKPHRIALLGSPPHGDADGYGWVVPERAESGAAVVAFREKPPPDEVRRLAAEGALVNTFVLVARARTLAAVLARFSPAWFDALGRAHGDPAAIEAAYAVLPAANFSREVLERIPHLLALVPLEPRTGWSDVGTPERLAAAYREPGAARAITHTRIVSDRAPVVVRRRGIAA